MSRHLHDYIPLWPLSRLYRAWVATMRFDMINRETHIVPHTPIVACLWHDELFSCVDMIRDLKFMTLVSPNQDGQLLGAIMKPYGIRVVEGSSTRGGAQALHEIIHTMHAEHYSIGLTVDGPRGPRHKAKPGAVWIAAQSGRPIVPIRTFYSKAKVFHSWDKFQLPLPFSRMTTVFGAPWHPEVDLTSSASIRLACRELEARLNAISEDDIHV